MGTMSFLLPAGLDPAAAQELEWACVAGGPDNMPWPTEVRVEPGRLLLTRDVEESGNLMAPWEVNGAGRLMGVSGTLPERPDPFNLLVELARGKVHQLRSQAADWQMGGLQMTAPLAQQIRAVSIAFGRAVTQDDVIEAGRRAQETLAEAYRAAEQLVRLYTEQMYQARHQRAPRLDSQLGCRLGPAPLPEAQAEALIQSCNSVCLPLTWRDVEPRESEFHWQAFDDQLDWAQRQGLAVSAGPLLDFTPSRLPDWIWVWKQDLASLAAAMCDYVEAIVKRYRGRIRTWQFSTATNCAGGLDLSEDELLWLTVRLAEAARQVEPGLALVVGIAQPWGEYMAREEHTHSPFIFADTLIRSGLNLAALDLEVVMGVTPRGSYCRDLLDLSRLLDLYTLLGVPLRVTLGYPSAAENDADADPELQVSAGRWRQGFTTEMQADWASQYAALALCKPSVRSLHWAHLSDRLPHQFPHCGLFDAQDQPKPVLRRLKELRENHLR